MTGLVLGDLCHNITMTFNTVALWGRSGFQNILGYTPRFLERLHDLIMVWLVVILIIVCLVRGMVFFGKRGFILPDSVLLETVWTLVPMVILISIAVPRIRLLCVQDAICQIPIDTLKVVSNQWN